MALDDLRGNEMMNHLLSSLESGQDIGHYGRLVFTMIARHFCQDDDELVAALTKNPNFSEMQARALVQQVRQRGYNPPRREKIMQWQAEQQFPICPGNDPDGCNVYRDIKFPDGVYQHIEEYHEQKAQADSTAG